MGLAQASRLLRRDREMAARLVQAAARFGLALAADLARAGADIIMVLEPCVAGGIMAPRDVDSLVTPALGGLLAGCRDLGLRPVLHICGDAGGVLPALGPCASFPLSLDSQVELDQAAAVLPPDTVIWGNLNPVDVLMRGDAASVTTACGRCLDAMASRGRFVLSSGCEVPPGTPLENLQAMVRAAGPRRA